MGIFRLNVLYSVIFWEIKLFQKFSELMNRGTRLSVISEISLNQTKDASSGPWIDLGFLCIDF